MKHSLSIRLSAPKLGSVVKRTISTIKTEHWCLINYFLWSSCTLLLPTLHQNSQHSFLWNSGPRQWGQFWPLHYPIILQTTVTFWSIRHSVKELATIVKKTDIQNVVKNFLSVAQCEAHIESLLSLPSQRTLHGTWHSCTMQSKQACAFLSVKQLERDVSSDLCCQQPYSRPLTHSAQ